LDFRRRRARKCRKRLVAFYGIRLRFVPGVEGLRNHVFIRFLIVTHHGVEEVALDGLP
jgi:hypothetical protein